jgi:hypothetical protein
METARRPHLYELLDFKMQLLQKEEIDNNQTFEHTCFAC